MNVSLLHHWLVSLRGGEKVLEQFCRLFPGAPVHTLVKNGNPGALGEIIPGHPIRTTLLDRLPFSERIYKSMLPLYPLVIGTHRVGGDFILSSDASMVKGMKSDPDVPHVCYCHSPPRYLWDMQVEYLNSVGSLQGRVLRWITPYLKAFDRDAAGRVDHFIANSNFVKDRIRRSYKREATVIHPPVDLQRFDHRKQGGDYFLVVSALVPYKRVELAVKAFNRLGKRLVVVGKGSELEYLESIAASNVEMVGPQPFHTLKRYYEGCRALVFPGIEDFGITPLEAQAAGKPVIAMGAGGALETVVDAETGLFFRDQTVEALADTVERFERRSGEFSPERCRENAERFSPDRFRKQVKEFLISHYPSYFSDFSWGNE